MRMNVILDQDEMGQLGGVTSKYGSSIQTAI